MNYDTTRRYSRTLSDAFPSERANCIEGPERTSYKAKDISIAVVVLVILVLIGLNSAGVWR